MRWNAWTRFSIYAVPALLFAIEAGCGKPPNPAKAAPPPPGARNAARANDARLVDVTEQAGIKYRWSVAGKRPLNILQTIGNGCALFDVDQDGSLDVLLVGPRVTLFRGDGHGRFTDVTAKFGLAGLSGRFLGCTVGDYDNDGFPDVYLSAYRGGALLHNEAGRAFRDVTGHSGIAPQPWGTSCSFADIDGDGRLDLYIGNYVRFGPGSAQLCSNHGIQTACGPSSYSAEKGVLYRNLGGGRFADVTRAWGAAAVSGKALGVAVADYDGSGRQSIAIANDEVPGDLLRNAGGHFVNAGAVSGTALDDEGKAHGGMGVDWGDYDNDGKLDLAVSTFQNEPKCLYHNEGGGIFADRSPALGVGDVTRPYVAFGIKFFDFDNDGFLDLIVANGHVQDNIAAIDSSTTYRQNIQLLRNLRGNRFQDVGATAGPVFATGIVGRGLAVGDYDNDGRVDVLVVDSEGASHLLHNETLHAGNWLTLKLRGARSNRDGIGALVRIEANGMKQLRRCATDGSYMSASDVRVHVGIGNATAARVTVRWPGGKSTRYGAVQANRAWILREGDPRAVEGH
jgi:enediyne biosynthesis protein E4